MKYDVLSTYEKDEIDLLLTQQTVNLNLNKNKKSFYKKYNIEETYSYQVYNKFDNMTMTLYTITFLNGSEYAGKLLF